MVDLSMIDIFGKNVNFTLEKNSKIQTSFGGFMTIIFLSAGSYFFFENGKEIYFKNSPISFQQTLLTPDYLNITIDRKTFPFGFQITDINGNSLNLTNKINIFLQDWRVTSEGVGFPAKTTTTNLNYTLENPNSTNSNFIMTESVTLSGSWSIYNANLLQIVISLCDNSTNSDCETRDEIFNFISKNQLNFNFFYKDVNLQLDNLGNPVSLQNNLNSVFITQGTKYSTFFFRNNKIFTDEGIFLSNINSLEYITIDSIFTDSASLADDSLNLFVGFFMTTNKTQTIHRSYLTIQAVLSQVGGLLNIIYFIFIYLNNYFADIKKNQLIINSIFHNVDDNLHENSEINKKVPLKSFSLTDKSKVVQLNLNKKIVTENNSFCLSYDKNSSDALKFQRIEFGVNRKNYHFIKKNKKI